MATAKKKAPAQDDLLMTEASVGEHRFRARAYERLDPGAPIAPFTEMLASPAAAQPLHLFLDLCASTLLRKPLGAVAQARVARRLGDDRTEPAGCWPDASGTWPKLVAS